MADGMKIRKIAAITFLVLGSFAADNVAPSKSELEAMYDRAFRAFDTNNFPEALKELDAIDARQPDLAESQNLRGVILMREGIYDKAEGALHEALRIDPKFWNARFNLAEIPFLKKDWTEARNRFQELLSSNASELQGEATQLIQYKILLTYLLEGKENMVDSILAKFELSPDTPAVHYANAAIALQRKNTKEARDWMAQAEKNFSPQLNKLFAESLYEVGWLEKQAGQTRAALELTTATERAAKSKAFARSRLEQARQAFQQRDFTAANKYIDDADAADPNQAPVLNLHGEILLEQKQFDQAEAEFKKAAKADPKFREAQYNLAQVPFKQKDYTKARDRFEALFSRTAGGDKSEAAQLIKFKIYMTLLLEGKESRAQKMMEQFEFTGDTPALYYAQAAWEFKHNNPNKATDWITSATKIYSPTLNVVFADAFYDLGWVQSPSLAMSPAPAAEAATALASAQTESSPAIEPSPIPGAALAKNKPGRASKPESIAAASPVSSPAMTGIEAMSSRAGESPAAAVIQTPAASSESFAAGTPAKPEEIPTSPAPSFSPVVETPVAAAASPASSAMPTGAASAPAFTASATPATALAPARVREVSQPSWSQRLDLQAFLVGGLVLAGVALLGWVIVPEIRRRGLRLPTFRRPSPVTGPRLDEADLIAAAPLQKQIKIAPRLNGGPRQISLKLKASEPSLRRAVVAVGKPARTFGAGPSLDAALHGNGENKIETPTPLETVFESSVGPVVEQWADPFTPERPSMPEAAEWTMPAPVAAEASAVEIVPEPSPREDLEPLFAQSAPVVEQEFEPIGQGQPIPELTPVTEPSMIEVTEPEPQPGEMGEFRQIVEPPPLVPQAVSVEPTIYEPTIPVTMPEPIQIPTAPAVRTPGFAPQPAGAMQPAPRKRPCNSLSPLKLPRCSLRQPSRWAHCSYGPSPRLSPCGSDHPRSRSRR